MRALSYLCLLTILGMSSGIPTALRRKRALVEDPEGMRNALVRSYSVGTSNKHAQLYDWLRMLYLDLPSMPKMGSPGRLWTFRPEAHPILISNEDPDTFMAIGNLGLGRVAAFGGPRYLKNISGREKNKAVAQFHDNLKVFLTNGQYEDDSNICEPIDSLSLIVCLALPSTMVLLFQGGDWPTEEENEVVEAWVAAGGALVHGFDGKKWEDKGGESVLRIGFYNVVLAAGIAYGPEIKWSSGDIDLTLDMSTAERLVSLNLIQVANSLTFETVKDNAGLTYLLNRVKQDQRYFPVAVAQRVLAPFEQFAINQESRMVWPKATHDNPKISVPVTSDHFAMFNVYYHLGLAHLWRDEAPNVNMFPGNLADPPSTETVTLTFDSSLNVEFYSVGYYLLPGQTMTLTVLNDPDDGSWTNFMMLIGSHTDDLSFKKEELKRWPLVKREVYFVEREMSVQWMFGGLLTIRTPAGYGNTLKVRISGVIQTPYYSLSDPASIADWSNRKHAAGLVADIRGNRIRFTIPASSARSLTDPREVLELWDQVVRKSLLLIARPEDEWRSQWMTADIQVSKGAMHSGYPIVGHFSQGDSTQDDFILSGIWGDHWGMFHELGHNLPQGAWTWPDTKEVTCNFLSMLHMERMDGQVMQESWPTVKIKNNLKTDHYKNWLQNPQSPAVNGSPKVGLLVYSQLIRDFGWNCQHGVFKGYAADALTGTNIAGDTAGKIQQWVIRWSMQVNYNLCPLFDFWLWPLDEATRAALEHLTPYLPDDIITQNEAVVQLLGQVLTRYPNVQRTIAVQPVCPHFPMEYI